MLIAFFKNTSTAAGAGAAPTVAIDNIPTLSVAAVTAIIVTVVDVVAILGAVVIPSIAKGNNSLLTFSYMVNTIVSIVYVTTPVAAEVTFHEQNQGGSLNNLNYICCCITFSVANMWIAAFRRED
jgi:hypothetical protein